MHSRSLLRIGSELPGLAAAARSSSGLRPNILWIVAKDLSPDLGRCGNDLVRTPNRDCLVAEGVRFDDCICTVPALWMAPKRHERRAARPDGTKQTDATSTRSLPVRSCNVEFEGRVRSPCLGIRGRLRAIDRGCPDRRDVPTFGERTSHGGRSWQVSAYRGGALSTSACFMAKAGERAFRLRRRSVRSGPRFGGSATRRTLAAHDRSRLVYEPTRSPRELPRRWYGP